LLTSLIETLLFRRTRAATVLVAADPESALLFSAAALRRLGARITRYDIEGGTLEACVPPASGTVRLRTAAEDALTTRVHVEGDARVVIRRFRSALSA
jgi:hypothetical protein